MIYELSEKSNRLGVEMFVYWGGVLQKPTVLRQQSKNDCIALASRPFVATRTKTVLVRDTLKPALIQSAK